MITEDYCSQEVYRLLREKGFNGEIHTTFDKEGYTQVSITHQMAMKWLREKKDIIIVIQPEYFNVESKCSMWSCDTWWNDNYEKVQGDFSSYEEAVEATLKYVLENLI